MSKQSGTVAVPDRRQRFREFMKRFNPTAPARLTIGEGLICQTAGRSVFKKLAARADLSLGSQQLVVGGIGSGKTTELLLAEQELAAFEEKLPLYIEVPALTDLSALTSGSLLASLGVGLKNVIESRFEAPCSLSDAFRTIKIAAHGGGNPSFPVIAQLASALDAMTKPGKLVPPSPSIGRDSVELLKAVTVLSNYLRDQAKEIVAIFDGLDRLIKIEQFWSVAEQDLQAMRPLEISVLTAGPLSVMYGQGRQVKDYFDEVHYLPPAISDPRESPFLFDILRRRCAEELMDETQMRRICLASGGVLRDLISLARSAGENAYLDDADHINAAHVRSSIEQLGNNYLVGLGTRHREILAKMLEGEGFSPTDSESMELLVTRRVLEQSESRYEVHPALATILPRS